MSSPLTVYYARATVSETRKLRRKAPNEREEGVSSTSLGPEIDKERFAPATETTVTRLNASELAPFFSQRSV